MIFKKGNTYCLNVFVKRDAQNVNIDDIEKVVFEFNDVQKIYPSDDVKYDNNTKCFVVNFSQKDTLMLDGNIDWEVAVRYTNGTVERTLINKTYSYETIIKEEI